MDINRWFIAARYMSTLAMRRWRNRRWERRGQAPVMVLFYHRVADTHRNDWTIGRSLFARQISWLQRHVELISLSEAQARIRSGVNRRLAASITFDDGYAENCDFALPLLIQEKIPCTYFVASHHMVSGEPFPHDVAAGEPLMPNSVEQIAELAAAGIEIGAHTRRHADLGGLHDESRLYQEIVGSGDDLTEVTQRPVRYFAFPYGQPSNMSDQAFRIIQDAGYLGACGAYGGYNFPGQPEFFFRRIHGDPDMVRFRNWMTFDPRKHARHSDFPFPPASPDNPISDVAAVTRDGDAAR